MTRSSIYDEYQELLVKPLDRVAFIAKFWLIVVFSDLTLLYVSSIITPLIYIQNNFVGSNIAGLIIGTILGMLIGTISGLLQYLWLRKYFIREWIIANSISYIFYSVNVLLILLWSIHFAQGQTYDVHQAWLTIYNLFFPFLFVASSLVQGCMQWLVFKTYLKKVNWWVWFPLMTGFISDLGNFPLALLLWFICRKKLTNIKHFFYYLFSVNGLSLIVFTPITRELLFNSKNQLLINVATIIKYLESWLTYGDLIDAWGFWFRWITGIFAFTAIQAIAICSLCKQNKDPALYIDSKSLFTTTTDIKQYSQIRSIINKLEHKINRIWKDELNTRFTLTYWLGVKNNGEILACHPNNQVSQDNFAATPLSQLISEQVEINTAIAKLQITFNDPGVTKIKSLSGIPLSLIAIRILSVITIFSPLAVYVVLSLIMRLS